MTQACLPGPIVWKSELLFRGVKYTTELSEAVAEGAAPGYWPYRKIAADGSGAFLQVPYLFKLAGCSYMLLEVDFDVAFGLAPSPGVPHAISSK